MRLVEANDYLKIVFFLYFKINSLTVEDLECINSFN